MAAAARETPRGSKSPGLTAGVHAARGQDSSTGDRGGLGSKDVGTEPEPGPGAQRVELLGLEPTLGPDDENPLPVRWEGDAVHVVTGWVGHDEPGPAAQG